MQNIQLAYDITKVSKLDQDRYVDFGELTFFQELPKRADVNTYETYWRRDVAHQARIYCEEYFKTTGERLTVQPFMCGYLFSCCGYFDTRSLDAIDYYKVEEDNLRIAVSDTVLYELIFAFAPLTRRWCRWNVSDGSCEIEIAEETARYSVRDYGLGGSGETRLPRP